MKTPLFTLLFVVLTSGCLCFDRWVPDFYQKRDLYSRQDGCPSLHWDFYRTVNSEIDFYVHNERENEISPTIRIVNLKNGTIDCKYLDMFKQNDVREVTRISEFKLRPKEKFYQAYGVIRLENEIDGVFFNINERGQFEFFIASD